MPINFLNNVSVVETAVSPYTGDKFVVLDSGVLKYRTGAQVRSDIGAGTGNGTVTGSGTTNYVSKWTSSTAQGNSSIYDDGDVGIGTTNPLAKLDVGGNFRINTNNLTLSSTPSWGVPTQNIIGAEDNTNGATLTLMNTSATIPAGGASGTLQFVALDDARNSGGAGYATASISTVSTSAPGAGNSGQGNLIFKTSAGFGTVIERMRINSSGVGIGTTNAVSKLQVNTGSDINAQFGIDSFGSFKLGDVASNYTGAGVFYSGSPGSEDLQVLTNTFRISGNAGVGIQAVANGDVYLNTQFGVLATLDASTNNFGIGTTTPSGKLEVRQAANNGNTGAFTNTHLKLTASATADNTGFVGITAATSTADNYGYSFGAQRTSGGVGDFKINYHNNSAAGVNRFIIDQDGNVGIGLTGPQAKLHVRKATGPLSSFNSNTVGIFENSAASYVNIVSGSSSQGELWFSDSSEGRGRVRYNHSDDSLQFWTANNERLRVGILGQIGVGGANYGTAGNVLTSNGSGSAPSWQAAGGGSYTPNIVSGATTASKDNLYIFTASATLTLPASPSGGDSIKVSNLSGTTTCVIARNGSNIMAVGEDMTLDNQYASFELIYGDATRGWVVVGGN